MQLMMPGDTANDAESGHDNTGTYATESQSTQLQTVPKMNDQELSDSYFNHHEQTPISGTPMMKTEFGQHLSQSSDPFATSLQSTSSPSYYPYPYQKSIEMEYHNDSTDRYFPRFSSINTQGPWQPQLPLQESHPTQQASFQFPLNNTPTTQVQHHAQSQNQIPQFRPLDQRESYTSLISTPQFTFPEFQYQLNQHQAAYKSHSHDTQPPFSASTSSSSTATGASIRSATSLTDRTTTGNEDIDFDPISLSRTQVKVEQFTKEDVYILKSLLQNGEKMKWRFISSKISSITGRRATSTTCYKKVKELYKLPSEKHIGVLGSSVNYIVHDSWEDIEEDLWAK